MNGRGAGDDGSLKWRPTLGVGDDPCSEELGLRAVNHLVRLTPIAGAIHFFKKEIKKKCTVFDVCLALFVDVEGKIKYLFCAHFQTAEKILFTQ